jgi:hypothetical protein
MLTIACVYKSRTPNKIGGVIGGTYSEAWVQKLRAGVERSFTVPHRFVCLTDVEIPGVETIPLINDWPGWWSKIELFRPGLFEGPTLFFDLDVVMRGNLDAMAGPFEGMVMLGDVLPEVRNSTAMWWDASESFYGAIYRHFANNVVAEVSRRQQINRLGDQSLIEQALSANDRAPKVWQEVLPADWFVPYSYFSKLNPALTNGLPEAARLIYCLGDPKFDRADVLPEVAELWR